MKTVQIKKHLIDYINKCRENGKNRLPSERALVAELGYSRATIGKVLGVLESEGELIRKKGSGTFITKVKKDKGKTVALLLRKAYHKGQDHFKYIIDRLSEYAEEHGIYIQIFDQLVDMFERDGDNNQLLRAIDSKLFDGVLFVSRMPVSIINKINSRVPAVAINNIFGDGSELPYVSCDYFQAGFMGFKHLLDKGHKDIVYLTTDTSHTEFYFELSGAKAAYQSMGIPFERCVVLNTTRDLSYFNKYVIDFFADSKCTACFLRSEEAARRLISVLRSINIDVPKDLSLVTVGDYVKVNHHSLDLTVIDNHLGHMAVHGMSSLLKLINGEKMQKKIVLLEPDIIERNSVTDIN